MKAIKKKNHKGQAENIKTHFWDESNQQKKVEKMREESGKVKFETWKKKKKHERRNEERSVVVSESDSDERKREKRVRI